MLEMLKAHGLDAGPTQRPYLTGAISGLLASAPALAVLIHFGSLQHVAQSLGLSSAEAAALQALSMSLGGSLYGRLFRRAANDLKGGGLFGLAYGYLLWQALAVPLLQWLPHQPLLQGQAALGLLLGHLAWGLVLGLGFRWVHCLTRSGLEKKSRHTTAAGWR